MELFVSHIANRIPLSDPKLTAFCVYFLLLLIVLLSTSRTKTNQHFLDLTQTVQLRGIAILLIMIGHLGSNVLVRNSFIPAPLLSTCGLYMFFFLSGYGLMRSHQAQNYNLSHFIKRRVNRVFIPYWITTALFLLLDYFVLAEQYPFKLIALTTLGINFHLKIQLLDYARWFITLILFFYCVFFIATRFKRLTIQMLTLLGVPITVCLLNYFFEFVTPYDPREGFSSIDPARGGWNPWHSFILPFPVGVLVAACTERLQKALYSPDKFQWKGLFLGLLFFGFFLLTTGVYAKGSLFNIMYTALLKNISFTLLSLSVILIFMFCSSCNLYYRIFHMFGSLSYELFLLHDAFMVKHDFILFRLPVKYSFFIFLIIICLLAYALKKSSQHISQKIFLQ